VIIEELSEAILEAIRFHWRETSPGLNIEGASIMPGPNVSPAEINFEQQSRRAIRAG
jgi:hypothetical protein